MSLKIIDTRPTGIKISLIARKTGDIIQLIDDLGLPSNELYIVTQVTNFKSIDIVDLATGRVTGVRHTKPTILIEDAALVIGYIEEDS